jgi:transglutaminase-like putative cysteine protease
MCPPEQQEGQMTATTYTITRSSGEVLDRGLTAEQAAIEIMSYDGHEFEIRPEPDRGFRLWTSEYSRNSTLGGRPLTESVIFSLAANEADARAEIYAEVIAHADWFKGQDAYTDEAYDAMLAEIEADDA